MADERVIKGIAPPRPNLWDELADELSADREQVKLTFYKWAFKCGAYTPPEWIAAFERHLIKHRVHYLSRD